MTPALFAHRAGPDGKHPENSLAALEASLKLGVDGVEIDVRRSADGKYFVFHDADVPRLGPVAALSASRLRRLGVCGLEEFLSRVTRGVVFVDVKLPYPARDLVRLCERVLEPERLIFGSFWHPFIREVKRIAPEIRGAVTLEARLVDPVRAARDARADILAVNDRFIDPETVRAAHRAGIHIFPWTVNSLADIRRLASLRVDAIITDLPSLLLKPSTTRGA